MDLAELLPSWELSLRAERKSPGTIKTYGAGVRRFITWCQALNQTPALSRGLVKLYIAESMETCEAATAGGRLPALKRFSAWCADENEQATDPLLGMKQPRLDQKVIEPLSDDNLRALLRTCGRDFAYITLAVAALSWVLGDGEQPTKPGGTAA